MKNVPYRLAHFSDTHLGYSAYRAQTPIGANVRSADIGTAFINVCKHIIDWDPSLVIHSGDLGERPQLPVRDLLVARRWLARLAALRPDGTRRQVVIISGNHDQPANRHSECFLELYADLPGVHVVTEAATEIDFGTQNNAEIPPELTNTVVTAVPHDQLKTLATENEFDTITPTPGKVSILVAHGVAGGSKLFHRTIGREYAIPTEVLTQPWDYVALGHWHKQGPVSFATSTTGTPSAIWYAGSTENMGFGDLREEGAGRGYLKVTIQPGSSPQVEPQNLPTRPMFRLPVIDATDLDPQTITTMLVDRLKDARAGFDNTQKPVVAQIVKNVAREVWGLVHMPAVRQETSWCLHYEVTTIAPENQNSTITSNDVPTGSQAILEAVKTATQDVAASRRQEVGELITTYLTKHLAVTDPEVETDMTSSKPQPTLDPENEPADTNPQALVPIP